MTDFRDGDAVEMAATAVLTFGTPGPSGPRVRDTLACGSRLTVGPPRIHPKRPGVVDDGRVVCVDGRGRRVAVPVYLLRLVGDGLPPLDDGRGPGRAA